MYRVKFENVRVLKKFTSKKGTKCVKVGWMSADSVGQYTFYGDEVYDRVSEGQTISVGGHMDGDFVRVTQVDGAGSGALDSGGNDSATSSERRRPARSAA